MNILLIYPPGWIDRQPTPPCGIATLKSSINNDHNVEIIDLEAETWVNNLEITDCAKKIDLELIANKYKSIDNLNLNDLSDDIISLLSKLASNINFTYIDIIGFSIMGSFQLVISLLLSKWIKNKYNPQIVYGGFYVSSEGMHKLIFNYGVVDYILQGESWESFPSFLNKLNNKNELQRIPELYFTDKIYSENILDNTPDINKMPIPDYSGYNLSYYPYIMSHCYHKDFKLLILRYLVGTGCPFKCNYCRRNLFIKYQYKEPNKIAQEVKILSQKYNTKLFSLDCSEINPTKSYINELSESIIREKCDINWYSYVYPSKLNRDILNKMYLSGCRMVRLGIESGSQRILNRMAKNLIVDEMSEILEYSHNAGIWNQINLIVGYPYENDTDIIKTCEFIRKNHKFIDDVRMHLFNLHHDTPLYCNSNKYNINIISGDQGKIKFDEINGRKWLERKVFVLNSLEIVHKTLSKYNIGYSGISSNLTFSTLIHLKDHNRVKNSLRKNHKYLFENEPIQTLRWKLYHKEEFDTQPFPSTWEYLYE
jgi:radical SAM superfamily enzyme YgiQ (UPF0313 family)